LIDVDGAVALWLEWGPERLRPFGEWARFWRRSV